MGFWASIWTVIWFAGLAIFAVLSLLVIVYGAKDIASLLRSLKAQHTKREE